MRCYASTRMVLNPGGWGCHSPPKKPYEECLDSAPKTVLFEIIPSSSTSTHKDKTKQQQLEPLSCGLEYFQHKIVTTIKTMKSAMTFLWPQAITTKFDSVHLVPISIADFERYYCTRVDQCSARNGCICRLPSG